MKENYARINGINLHYVEEGEGELVVLLHGFPDFWYGWRMQIPVLSKKYHVVAVDMRGYNLSDKPKRIRDYRIDILASDIAGLIRKLGYAKAYVVGHDWGGAVAWAVASFYPELVKKLVVMNIPHPAELVQALLSGNLAQLRKSYYIFLFQIPKIPEWLMRSDLRKFFKKVFRLTCFGSREALSDPIIQKYIDACADPRTPGCGINYYRAAARALRLMRLRREAPLPMPILMLWGEKDVALGKELTFNTKKYCRDLEIVYDPVSGHFIQFDNPELVNEKLLEFFQK